MNNIELSAADALKLWPEVRDFVEQALAHDPVTSVTADDLERQVAGGYAIVILTARNGDIIACHVVQRIVRKDGRRALHVVVSAGKGASKWMHMLRKTLEELARKHACTSISMTGRPGWSKLLNRVGFRVEHVTMSMEVECPQANQNNPAAPAA